MLVRTLDQVFGTKGWHGTTLLGALRGLTPQAASWRPSRDRHNVWELILHTAYWKYAVRRRLTGEAPGGFSRQPSDWPAVPAVRDAAALWTPKDKPDEVIDSLQRLLQVCRLSD